MRPSDLLPVLVTGLLVASCAPRPPEAATPDATAAPAAVIAPAPAEPETVGGWRIDRAAFTGIGEAAAAFRAPIHGGGEIGSEELRGRWTILAFWGLWSEDSLADFPYIRALSSAADQDPDLDFLALHIPPALGQTEGALGAYLSIDQGLSERGGGWKTALDSDGSIAAAFGVARAPTYLLIGPDLRIEAFHGELNESPEDGIKPLIRGVAELKKRTAPSP
jgi:hypothetical protein